jgi:hypothetical protein
MMVSRESERSDDTASAVTRKIYHVAVDGEGSATIVEFHCEGECYRLLIRVKGTSVTAEWIEDSVADRLRRL